MSFSYSELFHEPSCEFKSAEPTCILHKEDRQLAGMTTFDQPLSQLIVTVYACNSVETKFFGHYVIICQLKFIIEPLKNLKVPSMASLKQAREYIHISRGQPKRVYQLAGNVKLTERTGVLQQCHLYHIRNGEIAALSPNFREISLTDSAEDHHDTNPGVGTTTSSN